MTHAFASSIALVLLATATLGACGKAPLASSAPLPSELASIQCPADRPEHAVGRIARADVSFVCISKEVAAKPSLLRCDLDSRPMVCEDAGMILLRHDAAGTVSASPPSRKIQESAPGAGPTNDSELIVYFHVGPPRTHTFDAVETEWKFLLADGKDLLPQGFSFVKGTLCDRKATVLDIGTCNLEAQTASLYWNISISVRHRKDTPIAAGEYRTELAFWMKYLGMMVKDPGT